jgi:hypothetical protein
MSTPEFRRWIRFKNHGVDLSGHSIVEHERVASGTTKGIEVEDDSPVLLTMTRADNQQAQNITPPVYYALGYAKVDADKSGICTPIIGPTWVRYDDDPDIPAPKIGEEWGPQKGKMRPAKDWGGEGFIAVSEPYPDHDVPIFLVVPKGGVELAKFEVLIENSSEFDRDGPNIGIKRTLQEHGKSVLAYKVHVDKNGVVTRIFPDTGSEFEVLHPGPFFKGVAFGMPDIESAEFPERVPTRASFLDLQNEHIGDIVEGIRLNGRWYGLGTEHEILRVEMIDGVVTSDFRGDDDITLEEDVLVRLKEGDGTGAWDARIFRISVSPLGSIEDGDNGVAFWHQYKWYLHSVDSAGAKPGCGLKKNPETGRLEVNPSALAGGGLKVAAGEDSCALEIDLSSSCGLKFKGNSPSVDNTQLAGAGLSTSGECGLKADLVPVPGNTTTTDNVTSVDLDLIECVLHLTEEKTIVTTTRNAAGEIIDQTTSLPETALHSVDLCDCDCDSLASGSGGVPKQITDCCPDPGINQTLTATFMQVNNGGCPCGDGVEITLTGDGGDKWTGSGAFCDQTAELTLECIGGFWELFIVIDLGFCYDGSVASNGDDVCDPLLLTFGGNDEIDQLPCCNGNQGELIVEITA